MKLFYLILIMPFLFSCKSEKVKVINSNSIIGFWKNIDPNTSENGMYFVNDTEARVSCKVDTVLYYKYKIEKDTLLLKDINNEIIKCKLLQLDKDSLVFYNLKSIERTEHFYFKGHPITDN